MANIVDISLSVKGVLDKYGLNRNYIANSRVSSAFDSVAQEVVAIEASDAADATPTNITTGLTFDAGDVIYVENTSTTSSVYLHTVSGLNNYIFSLLKPQQGIALIAYGILVPQLSVEVEAGGGTVTVNLVVFRSSV